MSVSTLRTVLFSLLVMAIALPARADQVQLNNGNSYVGVVLEENDESVVVQADSVVWTVPRTKVVAITKDRVTADKELARSRTLADQRYKKKAPSKVVLYGTSWCVYCKKARNYLQSRKIDFVEKDVENDKKAADELQQKKLKAKVVTDGVPVIDVNGQLIRGYDVRRIEAALSGKKI